MPNNIYDTIIENITAEPTAWCQGEYETRKKNGKVSACLVGHVDLALRTRYITSWKEDEDGVLDIKTFVSKDKKKWSRRHKVVAHLASLIDSSFSDPVGGHVSHADTDIIISNGEGTVTGWNDKPADPIDDGKRRGKRTKSQVVALLRKASKQFPND